MDLKGIKFYGGHSALRMAQERPRRVDGNKETRQAKPPGSLLTTEEAAAFLAISAESLRRLCRRRAITFIQITPSEYRFDLPDLKEYTDSRRNRRKSAVK